MTATTRIRVLSDSVINKIAAGEVVDRPASVVKELLENALDAGARQIEVAVVAGGRESIVVTDNGIGMSRDDALLSIERHATSKIAEVEDIERIATFGFRGEALAAIAAVSRLSLRTCPQGSDAGTEIQVVGGRIQDVRDVGGPAGTRITVRNLFFNVPARRKFLRTEATELSHIRQVFLLYALAHPHVGLRWLTDEREAYRAPAGATLEQRIRDLFPNLPPDLLRPVEGERAGVRVTGYAGLPQLGRSDRSEQYLFVNRRPAGAPLIGFALNEVYQTLLPRGRYPVVFLFIDLDPERVDVNVHPTKKEVRFRDGGAVRDAVIEALRAALSAAAAIPAPSLPGAAAAPWPASPPAPAFPAVLAPISDLPPPRAFAYPRRSLAPFPIEPEKSAPARDAPAAETPSTSKSPWAWCRILGQVGGLFVVLETEDGLVLMDPHAAHERVLYERFLRQALAGGFSSQGLLSPETIELPAHIAPMVRRNLDVLTGLGFGLSEFGGDTFIVDAVPAMLGPISAREMLMEAAQSSDQGGARGGAERWTIERVAQAACKAAVKAHDRMTLEEIERLVVDLAATEMPYTCPHGRPTLMHLGFNELHRKFGRT